MANAKPTPKPKFEQPEGDFPKSTAEFAVRFVYVPGTGLFAGDGKSFYARGECLCWRILQESPALSAFLTRNPLATVVGVVPGKYLVVTEIWQGGTKLDDDAAKSLGRTLPWEEPPKDQQ